MKKTTVFLLIILMVVSIFVSCGENNGMTSTEYEYKVYDVGGYRNFDEYGVEHGRELDGITTSRLVEDSVVSEKATIEYENVQYECLYSKTMFAYGLVYYDIYTCTVSTPNGNLTRRFGLNRDTKEIVYYYDTKEENYVDPPFNDDTLSHDQIKNLAKEFLKKYVTDSETYILTDDGVNLDNQYYFTFKRFIDGIETFDEVSVNFDSFGNIWRFDIANVNKLKGYTFSELHNEEKLTQAVDSKLYKIYAEAVEKAGASKFEYDVESTRLIKMANGQYAFIYEIRVCFYWHDNSAKGDFCNMLVYLP